MTRKSLPEHSTPLRMVNDRVHWAPKARYHKNICKVVGWDPDLTEQPPAEEIARTPKGNRRGPTAETVARGGMAVSSSLQTYNISAAPVAETAEIIVGGFEAMGGRAHRGYPLRSFSWHILCHSEGLSPILLSCKIGDSKPLQGIPSMSPPVE